MAGWNGGGVFVRAYNWAADKAAAIKIIATRMDGEFDNYKTGLENCITRDGQTPPTQNINWNSKKITSLASGTDPADAVNYGQISSIARHNYLTNGGFDVWQSGAGGSAAITGTAARIRTADCWWAVRDTVQAGYDVSQQAGTVNRYSLLWKRTAANASVVAMKLGQSIQATDVAWMSRGTPPTVCFSFYAKKGANYSGGDLTIEVISGTSTNQNVLDGFTGAAVLATRTYTLTTTITRVELAAVVLGTTTQIGVRLTWTPTGAAGADDSVTIENAQLEVGSSAGGFDYQPFSVTLNACQRYYQKSFAYAVVPANNVGFTGGIVDVAAPKAGAVQHVLSISLFAPTDPEVSYVATLYNPSAANSQVRDATAGADCSASALNIGVGTQYANLVFTGNAGTAAGNLMSVYWQVASVNF